MQSVDTEGIEPMSHAQDVMLRLREDAVTESDQHALYQSDRAAGRRRAVPGAEGHRIDASAVPRIRRAHRPVLRTARTHAQRQPQTTLRRARAKQDLQRRADAALSRSHRAAQSGELNAFITVDAGQDAWRRRARPTRGSRAGDQAQPLTGIPVAHKDIFCAKGWLTTCGSKMLANFVSPYDAHVVERFERGRAP